MLTTRRYYGIYKKYGIFCHLSGYSEEVSMSTNSFDLIDIFEILERITFANMERVALTKNISKSQKMWNRTPGFLYNHCKIKLNSGVNIFTFSTSALHFLSFMMNYVVCLTLFPNLKVLVLAEILDLPCPNIFNVFAVADKVFSIRYLDILLWWNRHI